MREREVNTTIREFVVHVVNDDCVWTPALEFKGYESTTVYAREFAEQLAHKMGIDSDEDYCSETVEYIMCLLAEEFRKAGCRVLQQDDKLKIFRQTRAD